MFAGSTTGNLSPNNVLHNNYDYKCLFMTEDCRITKETILANNNWKTSASHDSYDYDWQVITES